MISAWSKPAVAVAYEEKTNAFAAPIEESMGPPTDSDLALPLDASQLLRSIERAFGQSFALLECGNGKVLRPAANGLPVDLCRQIPTCEQVAERGLPEIVDEVSPLLMLAVPLPSNTPGSVM